MESSGMLLSRSAAAELGLPGYAEPAKLSYGVEKGCPWRGSQGCLGPVRELAGGRLGCPYPAGPPCLRCRPKDGAEPPPPPRNGQPKGGWGEPCKERPGPRWAEAVLAPLALYSHGYHRYPLAVPGLDAPRPGTAGKAFSGPGDAAGEPPAFRHCPFLVEAKHSPFLLSSLLPSAPPAEPPFGSAEAPGAMGDGRFAGLDWRLGSYAPAWAQPLYLGVPPRCKAAPSPFHDCSGPGNKVGHPAEAALGVPGAARLQQRLQPSLTPKAMPAALPGQGRAAPPGGTQPCPSSPRSSAEGSQPPERWDNAAPGRCRAPRCPRRAATPGLSHGSGGAADRGRRRQRCQPWVRPSRPEPPRIPIPFPRWHPRTGHRAPGGTGGHREAPGGTERPPSLAGPWGN